MNTQAIRDEELTGYLLGALGEERRDEVERRLLADDELYGALLAAEDDLVDAYARDELDAGERHAFEERLAGLPGMAQRIGFARSLQRHASAERARESAADDATADTGPSPSLGQRLAAWLAGLQPAPELRLAAAAAAVLLVAATAFFAWQSAELSLEVQELRAAHTDLATERSELAARRAELADELSAARTALAEGHGTAEQLAAAERRIEELEGEISRIRRKPSEPRRVAARFLLTLATRSAGVPELAVPAAADRVDLQLDTAGDHEYYDRFQARLLGPGGAEVWSRTGLAADPQTGVVEIALPAELLPEGRYEALLEGAEQDGAPELVGAYEFQLLRR